MHKNRTWYPHQCNNEKNDWGFRPEIHDYCSRIFSFSMAVDCQLTCSLNHDRYVILVNSRAHSLQSVFIASFYLISGVFLLNIIGGLWGKEVDLEITCSVLVLVYSLRSVHFRFHSTFDTTGIVSNVEWTWKCTSPACSFASESNYVKLLQLWPLIICFQTGSIISSTKPSISCSIFIFSNLAVTHNIKIPWDPMESPVSSFYAAIVTQNRKMIGASLHVHAVWIFAWLGVAQNM